MSLTLYELAGADPQVRFSPHCWKIRMALAHKGLEAERRPWRFTDKEVIAFSGQGRVPVLVDGEQSVADSWSIAAHLDTAYPDAPALMAGESASHLARFVNTWADTVILPKLARMIVADVWTCLAPQDQGYFRETREARLGDSLEALSARRDEEVEAFRQLLTPLRLTLQQQPYLSGPEAGYADYCVFGHFMWARCIGGFELLAPDDPLNAWRDALLDAHDGMARHAPRAGSAAA